MAVRPGLHEVMSGGAEVPGLLEPIGRIEMGVPSDRRVFALEAALQQIGEKTMITVHAVPWADRDDKEVVLGQRPQDLPGVAAAGDRSAHLRAKIVQYRRLQQEPDQVGGLTQEHLVFQVFGHGAKTPEKSRMNVDGSS